MDKIPKDFTSTKDTYYAALICSTPWRELYNITRLGISGKTFSECITDRSVVVSTLVCQWEGKDLNPTVGNYFYSSSYFVLLTSQQCMYKYN